MREDDLTGRKLPLAAADDHVAGRARRFVRVVDDGLRELGARPDGRGRVARVDEDDGVALIEFRPDGLEVLVAEVLAVVGGKESDTIGLQLVERVPDGFDGALDVREAGQRAEEAESVRLVGADGDGVVVPFAGEGAAGCGGAGGGGACDFSAGGGEGEDGG